MSFRKPFTILRQEPGEYINGIFQAGSSSTITIQASVQPASGKDFYSLPEGRKVKQAFKVYTDSRLYTGNEFGRTEPDKIKVNDEYFEIVSVAPYQSGILSHYEALAVL